MIEDSITNAVKSVVSGVFAQCGDGWGLFVSDKYKEAAQIFEEIYKNEPWINDFVKSEGDRDITFLNFEEVIIFISSRSKEDIDFLQRTCDVVVYY